MDEVMFKERTMRLGVRVAYLVAALPASRNADVLGGQVLRSATSVGANYRAACRARSAADMIARLKLVEEEADETLYWLELIVATGLLPQARLGPLMQEADEILAMTVASIKTLRAGLSRRR